MNDKNAAETSDERPEASISDRINKLEDGHRTVICIPVWGWTAHGKTCALLTATQSAQVETDGITYQLVKDTRPLEELEASEERYAGLGLANAARVTTERMRELYNVFFKECQWPHGTETPTSYLFEMRSIEGTAGYVLFPDLRGGSYQELDGAAISAIDGAHGCILILDATTYVAVSPTATEYRDDVLRLLQGCNERSIPMLLLLARSDTMLDDASGPLDEAKKRLNQLTSKFSAPVELVAASAMCEDKPVEGDNPIPADERAVGNLLTAWVSITVSALERGRAELMKIVPPTNLQAQGPPQRIKGEKQRELRLARELSDSPGSLIAIDGRAPSLAFLFLDAESGVVHEAAVELGDNQYKLAKVARAGDWSGELESEVGALVRSGTLFLGELGGAGALWVGALGQDLQRTPLPVSMTSWCPASSGMVVGVDEQGTLHSLELAGGKWKTRDYVESFIPPTPTALVTVLEDTSRVVCLNGIETKAILIDTAGNFIERIDLGIQLPFNVAGARINELGFCAGVTAPNNLQAAWQGATCAAGTAQEGGSLAVAQLAPRVAWISTDGKLMAGELRGESLDATTPSLSPRLEGALNGLQWSREGAVLGVSYSDGRWGWYRALGFAE